MDHVIDIPEVKECDYCKLPETACCPLISPCKCKGTNVGLHEKCMLKSIVVSRKRFCTVCKTPFFPNEPRVIEVDDVKLQMRHMARRMAQMGLRSLQVIDEGDMLRYEYEGRNYESYLTRNLPNFRKAAFAFFMIIVLIIIILIIKKHSDLAYEGGCGVGEAFLFAAQGYPLLQTIKEGLRGVEY